MSDDQLSTIDGDSDARRILQATLAFVCRTFGAAAASVMTCDPGSADLRFAAVSGAGGDRLVGLRVPRGEGIAGMVLQTGEAAVVADLATNAQFNRSFAISSGYVPNVICAAPLLYDDDVVGVLEVLDPVPGVLGHMELLEIVEALADQVATSIFVLGELRRRRGDGSGRSPGRDRVTQLLRSVPDSVLDDGRGAILEAVLREFAQVKS